MFLAPPAQALTVLTVDPEAHSITVKAGSDSTKLVVEPDKAVEPACASGCIIELENGEQYEMKGGEQVSIEGGIMFVDAVPENETMDAAPTGAVGSDAQ
jgi:hypothetical protein